MTVDYTKPKKNTKKLALWLGIILGGTLFLLSLNFIFYQTIIPGWLFRILPFVPHNFTSLDVKANEEIITCKNNETCFVRPSDKIIILSVRTDGLISSGLKLASPEIDIRVITTNQKSPMELMPQADFDESKSITIEVFWFRWKLGKTTITAKWTLKDWLERAQITELPEKKVYFLRKALQENPEHVLARNQLAGFLYTLKKYEEASQHYEIILQKGFSRIIMERLTKSYMMAGNKTKAIEGYVELIKRYPTGGYLKEWFNYLRKNMGPGEIIKVVGTYGQSFPDSLKPTLWIFISDVCSDAKNWDCVAEYSERALKSSAGTPTLAYNTAVAYYQKKDYQKAIDYFKKYLSTNPNDFEAQKMIAICYENLKDWNQAEEIYRKMVENGHTSEEIINKWLEMAERTNSPPKIINVYQKLVQLKPNNATLWYNLGVLYTKQGQKEEAKKSFEKAMQINPNDTSTLKSLRSLYKASKDTDKERDILLKLMKIEPTVESHYIDFYNLSDKTKNIGEVTKVLKTCIEKIPKATSCYDNLLFILLKNKKEKEAVEVLEKLIELKPDKPELLLQAAKLYYNQKNYDKALAKLKAYLDKNPTDENTQDLYIEIRKKAITTTKQGDDSKKSR